MSALGKGATVIYIGHSLGADSALRFAQAARNFKLPLVCPVDPVSWDSNAQQVVPGRWEVGSNVARVIGYRTNTFPGGGRIVLAAESYGHDHRCGSRKSSGRVGHCVLAGSTCCDNHRRT
jgi:hypothetical protein